MRLKQVIESIEMCLFLIEISAGTTFIDNYGWTNFQIGIWRYYNRKRKRRSTKEKKERPAAMKTEQTYSYLYNVFAAADDDDGDDYFR